MVEQRNAKGQFNKGWKGGPGRKKKKPEDKYLRAFSQTLKVKDFKEIVSVVIARAKAGDASAARLILEHGLGKPPQRVEVATTGDLNIALVWPEDEKHDDSPSGAA